MKTRITALVIALLLCLTNASIAASAEDIMPLAYGKQVFTVELWAEVPDYYDPIFDTFCPKRDVVFYVDYEVTYDLSNGKISSVRLVSEGTFPDYIHYGNMELNSIHTDNFNTGHTISSDRYSITFDLTASASVTYRVEQGVILDHISHRNIPVQTVTVTPNTD